MLATSEPGEPAYDASNEREETFAAFLLACRLAEISEEETTSLLTSLFGRLSQSEVAAVFGCTRQRVDQIEQAAMKKLRRSARLMGIKNPFGALLGPPLTASNRNALDPVDAEPRAETANRTIHVEEGSDEICGT